MNEFFYTYGNKELITSRSFSGIPAEVKPVLQPLMSSFTERMQSVKELRAHLHDFEKVYTLHPSADFKSRIIVHEPMTPARIRQIRNMLKMTQYQFGSLLGTSKTTVSYWENGHLHPCWENEKVLHTLAVYGIVGLRKVSARYAKKKK